MATNAPNDDTRQLLLEAGRALNGSLYRLVHLAAAVAAGDDWRRDGAPTPAHWIAGLVDVEVCTAREWVRCGSALAELSLIDEAFAAGRVSFSKVRAITRVATPEHESELLSLAETLPAGQMSRALARWRMRQESPTETEVRQHRERSVTINTDPDGMVWGRFRLTPLVGGALRAALDADLGRPGARHDATAVEPSGEPSRPTLAQQRADALAGLIDADGEPAAIAAEVVLHVRGDGTTLDDGTPVPDSVVERIASGAFLRVMIHDADRRPINVSGRHRHPSRRQQLVVLERDGHACSRCGSRDFLQFHHEPPFSRTGHTVVEELTVTCGRCHRELHRAPGTVGGAPGPPHEPPGRDSTGPPGGPEAPGG